jgi:putative FmdB family regulatory protein
LPTYEYRCDSCDRNFDIVQSFHDEPLTACPTCCSPVRKVFGNVGIVFKGSGFYKTDSRSGTAATKDGGSDGSATSTAESSGPGSGSGSGSESDGNTSGGDGTSTAATPPPTAPAKPGTTPSTGGDGRGSSKPKTAPA